MLEAWLDFHRATLALKCSGLKDDQLRLPAAAPSSMTLLGLVQHLAEVERNWFQRVFAGRHLPPVFGQSNGDGFALQPDQGLDEAMAAWQGEVARGRELIADASLDDSGRLSEEEARQLGGIPGGPESHRSAHGRNTDGGGWSRAFSLWGQPGA